MSTSGSVDYSETTATIIKDAFIEIGAVDVSEAVEAESAAWAKRKLNRILKRFQAAGANLWRATEGSVTLVVAKQSYTMGGTTPDVSFRPLTVSSVRYRDANGIDRPLTPIMARQQYFDLPKKDTVGVPTSFYYDPGRNQGQLFVWPVIGSVTTETLKVTYQRTIEDMDGNADNPDLPQEWFDAIVLGLAAEICGGLFPGNTQLLIDVRARAGEALETAQGFDRETASVYFMVDSS